MPRASSAALQQAAAAAAADLDGGVLDAALAILRERDGLDLSGYRRSTLARRVRNRMISAGARGPADYLERLRADPGETPRLLDRLTIKVSRFFRNPAAVAAVRAALAAELARAPRRLALWSAGCGRGEEPYTLARLLADLGQPDGAPAVLATDLDEAALAAARRARYAPDAVGDVPGALRERWVGPADAEPGALEVRPELRARVSFARHDLVRDEAPRRGGFDLVACRNALIYFDPPLQQRALRVLCDAIAPGGLLWLGEAEWPAGDVAARLVPVSRQARLFRLEGRAHA
ncbi:MAG TPA: CheR family methyltransferase [Anaeromyxobacter sp.]